MSRDSSADKFCLKWNDFDSNLRSSFQKFREEKDFFDVSLVCEDEQVDAHRMVLSASSAFFKNLFKRNKHQHPLVYLKGVSSEELNCLLQFMYQGEVTVAQEEITTFLAAAEELKIHGLTQNLHKDTKEPSKPKKKSSTPPKLLPKQIKSDKVNPSNNSNSESDADVVIPMMPPVPITDMYDDSHDDIAEVPVDDPLGGHGASSMVPYYSDYDESHSSSIDLADDKYLFNNMMQGINNHNIIRQALSIYLDPKTPSSLIINALGLKRPCAPNLFYILLQITCNYIVYGFKERSRTFPGLSSSL